MTCADFQSRISPYLDGELSHWARWKVQTHLRQCPECTAMLQEMEAVDQAVLVSLGSAPDYLTDAVMHRLPQMPPAWRRAGATLTWSAGLAVIGMQLLALCGAYWWGFVRGSETEPGPPVDRGNLISAPGASIRVPKAHSDVPPEPSRTRFKSGGVWSSHIDASVPVTPPKPTVDEPNKKPKRKPASAKPSQFFPQFQMEGAR